MSRPKHVWKIGAKGRDACKLCGVLRQQLANMHLPARPNVYLFSFPKIYKLEWSIWSTFVPGCVEPPKAKAKVRK